MCNIKNIIKLQKSKKERQLQKKIFIEGYREIKMAIINNYYINKIFICKPIFIKKNKKLYNFITKYKKIEFIKKKNYNKLVYRKNIEGIIGIFKAPQKNYEKEFINLIKKKKKILFFILDNIEKPGNIGAIIRTIESTNIVDSIIIAGNKDIYNPNIIRASLGCVFILSIIKLPIHIILKYIVKYNISLFGTTINKNEKSLYKINFNTYNKIAIIFGNEHSGISKIWFSYIIRQINIPMYGKINSLNVSVAVSIIIFEILRQIKFKN
ncbi:MAG: RNA methyltransferase [Candidatus Shikimatogenerans bostrichidophilus]|nr:MAG: RNA methyltransferase [Candidatus Shikimatogenerans bostrichidophilus]